MTCGGFIEFMRAVFQWGVPSLGSCVGLQIASVAGAELVVSVFPPAWVHPLLDNHSR